MKIEDFFDQKNIIELSFFNFANAITAAYYANLSFASFCSIYGVMGTRAPCKTTPLISGLVG